MKTISASLDLKVAFCQGWALDPNRPKEELQIIKRKSELFTWEQQYAINGIPHEYAFALAGDYDKHFGYSPTSDWSLGGQIFEDNAIKIFEYLEDKYTNIDNFKKGEYWYKTLVKKCACQGQLLEELMQAYVYTFDLFDD